MRSKNTLLELSVSERVVWLISGNQKLLVLEKSCEVAVASENASDLTSFSQG
jgi:hypothetical protein